MSSENSPARAEVEDKESSSESSPRAEVEEKEFSKPSPSKSEKNGDESSHAIDLPGPSKAGMQDASTDVDGLHGPSDTFTEASTSKRELEADESGKGLCGPSKNEEVCGVPKRRKILPTSKKIGFLGIGERSLGIVTKLCYSGHSMAIWKETLNQCRDFPYNFNCKIFDDPAGVIDAAEIILSVIPDRLLAMSTIIDNLDRIKNSEHREKKGIILMASWDPSISKTTGFYVKENGGRYLEAPFIGTRNDAISGNLIILAAGDKTLYEDCESCFDSISKKHEFVNEQVGIASKFHSIQRMVAGTVVASVAEGLATVKEFGFDGRKFLDILKEGEIINENIRTKGMSMIEKDYSIQTSLWETEQHFKFGLSAADEVEQPTPIFAVAKEVYKRIKDNTDEDLDVSAVFEDTQKKIKE